MFADNDGNYITVQRKHHREQMALPLIFLPRCCVDEHGLAGALFVNGAEFVLAYAAEGAYPVFGEFFEWGAWLDAVVGVAYCGIILVAAYVAYILFHEGGVLKGY